MEHEVPEEFNKCDLIFYRYREPVNDCSSILFNGQRSLVANQHISKGSLIMKDYPIVSYRRGIKESSIPLLFTLNKTSLGVLSPIIKLCCELNVFPQENSDAIKSMMLMYRSNPEEITLETAAEALKQPEHVLSMFIHFNEFSREDLLRILYLHASSINHSCKPNATFKIDKNNTITVTALKAILKNEEITICYEGSLVMEKRLLKRRVFLNNRWGFICECDHCEASDEMMCMTCSKHSTLICGKCKIARYCSKECQKKDWSDHKDYCFALIKYEQ